MTSMNRRDFLKGAAVTGGAAALMGLAGCSPQGSKASKETSDTATASNAHPWETTPEPIADIAETKDYDIVIVGAGIAGLSAAEAAARSGAKTVVLDRAGQCSGRGQDFGGIGARVQIENGVNVDPEEAARLLHQSSMQMANYNLIYTWASRSGKVFDHIEEIAKDQGYQIIPADGSSGTAKFGWNVLEERFRVLQTGMNVLTAEGENLYPTPMCTILETAASSAGAEFVYNTHAEQLVGNASEGITGVIVTAEDGKHVQYNAAKGVILATGDIGGSEEMLKAWCPIALRADANGYMPEGCNTGDGLLMGLWAGAALSRSTPAHMVHQFAFDNYDFPLTSFYMAWLNVDRRGIRYGADLPFEPYLTNARMCTPGNVAWSIFDSDYDIYVKRQQPDTYDSVLSWAPEAIEEFQGTEFLYKADTIEELAGLISVPADALQNTIDHYNELFESGEDPDFGVPAQFLSQVKTPPFYATPNLCSTLVVPYGLHVNDDSQVCTEEDEPIAGLFAIGNVQGDFFSFEYPVHCPGVSHGRCITFGQLVGEALAHDTVITQTV
ncbi:FAD-dependent oxidoreductase [Eggerthella sp. YY7918]|uniref:FAD-dependent oxidoreductase n=1 Tax=Eggerthella sp. (strain YY7918) TaxID=502558 RepID=UPI00021710E7|nr:FAD-dependent oxidoreductase [Eggerthella sp. YY7918]BAK43532.1 hypothetical protein EGYY_02970 [Eggerthella sp. YY7918]